MIVGTNEHFAHEGTDYHIQVEDLDGSWELEVRVYVGGTIVFNKRQSYLKVVEGITAPGKAEMLIADEMRKLVVIIKAAIQKGRIAPPGA
jgi:hypothetical protein